MKEDFNKNLKVLAQEINVNLNTKLSSLHPADIADIIEELDESERSQVFESLDEDLAADTFEEIEDDDVKGSIIKDLSESKTAELLENMDNDEIADLLDELEGEEREKVLYNLEKEDAEEIEELLKYEDETVGSLMTKEFVAVNYNLNISETIEILKELDPDEDVMYYIYTIDEEGKLKDLKPSIALINQGNQIVDVLAGDVIFTSTDGLGNTLSLYDNQIKIIKEEIKYTCMLAIQSNNDSDPGLKKVRLLEGK